MANIEKKYYLAVDLGATSGRHIVGCVEKGEIVTREVYRFPNGARKKAGALCWDLEELTSHVKRGIREALALYPEIESLAIDTWGVDYVLMKGDKEILPAYAYRDGRTESALKKVEEIIPFADLYARTGIQFAAYNTIYQLVDDGEKGRLKEATDFLMTPDYLNYRLTGVKMHEYTEATTTGLISPESGDWDRELIGLLGLPERLFGKLSAAGATVGYLLPEVAEEVGGNIKVVLCASHDTASAVEAIPIGENDSFISSGTWSLLGAKLSEPLTDERSLNANFSNEGGAGYICYLKNIMGMWIINELRKELCPDKPFPEIISEAANSTFEDTVDVDEEIFFAPESMSNAFLSRVRPSTTGDFFKCAFKSLALKYAQAIKELEEITRKSYDKLYIVGGGAKNEYLNKLTAEFSGKEVVALPIEATAIGNIKMQIKAGEKV